MHVIKGNNWYYHATKNSKDDNIVEIISEVASIPGCIRIAALPDSHIGGIEIPNSAVAIFDDMIVPQLGSDVVNCGFGLLNFDLTPDELISKRNTLIMNLHKALHDRKTILTKMQFLSVLEEGPYTILPLLKNLSESCMEYFFEKGVSTLNKFVYKDFNHNEIIPKWIFNNKDYYMLPENKFSGNHYIEWLRYGKDLSSNNLPKDYSYCSYHTDSSFTKALNWTYTTRKKERKVFSRRVKRLLSSCYHLKVEGFKALPTIYEYYLKINNFTPIPIDCLEGQRYLKAIIYSMNYGNAERLALLDLLIDVIEDTFNRSIKWNLIFDSGHDTFSVERIENKDCVVSRKGCIKADEFPLGMISGFYNVPSIVIGKKKNINNDWLNSYDHGIGGHKIRSLLNRKKTMSVGNCKVDDVYCYKFSTLSNYNKYKINKESVYITSYLDNVVNIYNNGASPVNPIALLYPLINYKIEPATIRTKIKKIIKPLMQKNPY